MLLTDDEPTYDDALAALLLADAEDRDADLEAEAEMLGHEDGDPAYAGIS